MATKKKAVSTSEIVDDPRPAIWLPEDKNTKEKRTRFVEDIASQILLAIAAKRSNGAPVRGDELAAVTSATELANLLGIK